MTNIAILSDIHGNIEKYKEVKPEVDLVILPGDLFALDGYTNQLQEVPGFKRKIDEMFPNASDIIVVPGNHDYLLERIYNSWNSDIEMRKLFTYKYTLLVDREMMYINPNTGDVIKLYGAPRTSLCMAFPHHYGESDMKNIPSGLDILVTHEAPRWYDLDCVREFVGAFGNDEPGNYSLYERVKKAKPKYHVFGHIHRKCIKETPETTFINVSQMDRNDFRPEIIYLAWEGTNSL